MGTIDFDTYTAAYTQRSVDYRPLTHPHVGNSSIKVIAYYLPQFHPIAENNAWWGEGFTEWTNVTKSVPQFRGHYQPHLPGELGFYDLRLKATQRRQIELARNYGIHGFCYHHYWFNGRRLLEAPFNQVLDDPSLDFPFCLCWANENWTRHWDGVERDVLIEQRHSPDDDLAFIADISRALKDPRYIRVDGRALLVVHRAARLPDPPATAARWRAYCRVHGIGELYLVAAQTLGVSDPRPLGFDAIVEYPPLAKPARLITEDIELYNPQFRGRIYSYPDLLEGEKRFTAPDFKVIKSVMPGWDNSARRPGYGTLFVGSTPGLFAQTADLACQYAMADASTEDKFVFVNAWNEWAEGAHLEPDRRYGYAYLEALAHVIARYSRDGSPLVSVVVPAYNHATYIEEALCSVEAQSYSNVELIVVDDGSSDGTPEVIERFLSQHPRLRSTFVAQANQGSQAAIDQGVSLAHGELIAILNSDDRFDPERLRTCVEALISTHADFVFTGVTVFKDDKNCLDGDTRYAHLLEAKLNAALLYPSIAYAILDANIGISTGNFFFKKSLYVRLGGFSTLKLCHDWDFLLQAVARARVTYVPKPLYVYRLHDSNTIKKIISLGTLEAPIALARFFNTIDPSVFQALFPDRAYLNRFLSQRNYGRHVAQSARRLGLEADGCLTPLQRR